METIVLKKLGIATAAAAAAALTFGGVALANDYGHDDGHSHGHVYSHKVQECGHSYGEGKLQLPPDSHSSNNDSHDGDCDQKNSPDDDSDY